MSDALQAPDAVYTADSLIREPITLAKQMWSDLLASRGLAWRLCLRNIRSQYRKAFLGMFWAFIPSIVMATGFTLAGRANVIRVGATEIPYPAYIIFSMVLWQTFLEALNGPIQALQASRALLGRVNFPKETIILARLGEVFFNFGIKLVLLVVVFIWYRMRVQATLLLAPCALVSLVMLGTTIGLMLAPFAGLYEDISRGLGLATGFWLFITPVVYPVPTEGVFAVVVNLNPVTHVLVTTRELATTGTVSNPEAFWIVSALAFCGLLAAWVVFRLAMPFVIERMGN